MHGCVRVRAVEVLCEEDQRLVFIPEGGREKHMLTIFVQERRKASCRSLGRTMKTIESARLQGYHSYPDVPTLRWTDDCFTPGRALEQTAMPNPQRPKSPCIMPDTRHARSAIISDPNSASSSTFNASKPPCSPSCWHSAKLPPYSGCRALAAACGSWCTCRRR